MTNSVPVAPDAVRVWRGFRNANLTYEQFFEKLGSIFIPGTVQIQSQVGLAAYLPSVLPVEKHAAIPDEIAIVFYEYKDAYAEAKLTVAGRAYSYLHDLVFSKASHSGFPERYDGRLEPDGRYYLFDDHVDWQRGHVNVFVGVRPEDASPETFLRNTGSWLSDVQSGGGPDGAIAVATFNYIVYWECWPTERSAGSSALPGLAKIARPAYQQVIPHHPLNEGVWAPYDGVRVAGGESFNFEFKRRKET